MIAKDIRMSPVRGRQTDKAVGASNDPIKIFFDVAFILCICPFRLTIKEGGYSASSWLPQQVYNLLYIINKYCYQDIDII